MKLKENNKLEAEDIFLIYLSIFKNDLYSQLLNEVSIATNYETLN